MRAASIIWLWLATAGVCSAQDLAVALEQTQRLVREHRYREVIDLLSPFTGIDDPEVRYAVTAELGRAHFHLGDYLAADTAFREAVALRPQRAETALYLMATSYVTGNRPQAYEILRELLRSGATDLHLAVTLPGEQTFLADPAVWEILHGNATRLDADPDTGRALGVELGQPRFEVESTLGTAAGADGTAVTARAGPFITWAFGFDDSGSLAQIMLHNEHLVRYTPYRLRLGSDLDWRATPENATASLGAPRSTATSGHDVVIMEWHRGAVRLILEFATFRTPLPQGLAPDRPTLRVVRMQSRSSSTDATGP